MRPGRGCRWPLSAARILLQSLARDAFPLVLKEPGLSLSPCIISSFSTPGEAVSGRQPISRYLKILRENDKDRFSADLLQIPCFVAFAGYILHQQISPAPKRRLSPRDVSISISPSNRMINWRLGAVWKS